MSIEYVYIGEYAPKIESLIEHWMIYSTLIGLLNIEYTLTLNVLLSHWMLNMHWILFIVYFKINKYWLNHGIELRFVYWNE